MDVGDLVMGMREFTAPNVFNPWRDADVLDAYMDGAAMDRRTRLYQHFNCTPEFLLIGEAPGYQGCHFSGVPFTNEKLILEGAVPRVTGDQRLTTRRLPWSEPSATIMWRTLHELGIADKTVMWNAFAWHPHKPMEPMTNRAPTKDELLAGSPVLAAVLTHFATARKIAVGRVAYKALHSVVTGVFETVRHPSMGGAKEFRDKMRLLVGKRR